MILIFVVYFKGKDGDQPTHAILAPSIKKEWWRLKKMGHKG